MEKAAAYGESSTAGLPRKESETPLSEGTTNTTSAASNITKSTTVADDRSVTFEDLDFNNEFLIKMEPNDFEDGLEYSEEFLHASIEVEEEENNEIFQDKNDTSSSGEIRSDKNSKRKKNHRKKIVTLAQKKSYPQPCSIKSGGKSKHINVDFEALKTEAIERLEQLKVSVKRLSQRSSHKKPLRKEHILKKLRTKLSKAPKKSNDRSFVIQPSSSSSSVIKSSKRTWTCKDCQETFPKKDELRIHRREYHPVERRSTSSNEKNVTTCDKCGKSFSRPFGLKYHLEHVHIDVAEKELIERKYVCETCGKKFLKKSHLMFHNQSHTGIKLFPCRKGCGKSFQGSTGRKRHEEKCNGEPCEEESTQDPKPVKIRNPKKSNENSNTTKNNPRVRTSVIPPEKEFTRRICQFCERAFKLPSQCQRHERIHTGEKIHKCTYENCTAKFSQAVSLKDHISSIHTGEYLECPHEQCEHKFLRILNLKYHIKVKHEQKKSICSTCKLEFATKANLVRHEMIHKGMKPFICSTCGMAFRLKYKLTKHMKTHLNPKRRVRRPKQLSDGDEGESSPKKRKESKVPKPDDKEKRIYSYDKHFYCNIENCSKGFATKRSMVVHIKKCHGLANAGNVGAGYVPRRRERKNMRISSEAAPTRIRSVKHQERQETLLMQDLQGFVPPQSQPSLQLPETPQFNYSQQLTSSYPWQQNLSLFPPYVNNQQPDLDPAPPPTHGHRHTVSQYQWNNANPAQTPGEIAKIDYSETGSSAMSDIAVYSKTNSVVDDWENESQNDNDNNDFHSGDFSGSDNETPEISPVKQLQPLADQPTLASTSQSHLKIHSFLQNSVSRQFKCKVCGRRYRSELDLSIHEIVHNDHMKDDSITSTEDNQRKMGGIRRKPRPRTALPLDCDICGKTFDRRNKLFRHKQMHDPNLLPYKCRFCSETFKHIIPLREHNQLEHPEYYTKFQCHLCEMGFASKRSLNDHKYKVHSIPREDMEFNDTDPSNTTCHICRKVCSHISALQRHMMVHDLTILPYSCKESNCIEKFRSVTALSKHVESNHPDSTLFRCNVCQLCFNNDKTLLRHKRTQHVRSSKTYPCTFEGCTRTFKSGQSVKYHIEIVHIASQQQQQPGGSNRPLISCSTCPKQFTCEAQMYQHQKSVHKLGKVKKLVERPLFHTCDVCERNFERPWALRRHKLTHSEEKAFKCPEEGCGKEFARRGGFNSHMKQHKPKKTFQCPVEECGKEFSRKDVFNLHMKKKHIKTEAAEFSE